MWVIFAQAKGDMFIPNGTTMLIFSVSLDFKKCFVDRAFKSRYPRVEISVDNLEGFRPQEVEEGYKSGMQFLSKEDANEYVKRLSNGRKFELPPSARDKSGILIARGEYTREEANELMEMVKVWNGETFGPKLVLFGDFEFAYTNNIKDVRIVDGIDVELTSERLSLVLDDLDDLDD
jgi:hypothetical protein